MSYPRTHASSDVYIASCSSMAVHVLSVISSVVSEPQMNIYKAVFSIETVFNFQTKFGFQFQIRPNTKAIVMG